MFLTDEQWQVVQPLLPPPLPPGRRGRPVIDQRRILNGILWKLATRCPWDQLPPSYPSYQVCYLHFRRWMRSGLLRKVITALLQDVVSRGGFDIDNAEKMGIIRCEKNRDRLEVYIQSQYFFSWQVQTALLCFQLAAIRLERQQSLNTLSLDPLEVIFRGK
jgi:transposase